MAWAALWARHQTLSCRKGDKTQVKCADAAAYPGIDRAALRITFGIHSSCPLPSPSTGRDKFTLSPAAQPARYALRSTCVPPALMLTRRVFVSREASSTLGRKPALDWPHVLDLQGHQLRAPERRGNADQQHGPVAPALMIFLHTSRRAPVPRGPPVSAARPVERRFAALAQKSRRSGLSTEDRYRAVNLL